MLPITFKLSIYRWMELFFFFSASRDLAQRRFWVDSTWTVLFNTILCDREIESILFFFFVKIFKFPQQVHTYLCTNDKIIQFDWYAAETSSLTSNYSFFYGFQSNSLAIYSRNHFSLKSVFENIQNILSHTMYAHTTKKTIYRSIIIIIRTRLLIFFSLYLFIRFECD